MGVLAFGMLGWLALRAGVPARVRQRPVTATLSGTLTLALAAYPAHTGGGGGTQAWTRWHIADPLGTTVVVVDNAGYVVSRQKRDPYGMLFPPEWHSEIREHRYAGHRREPSSGLHDSGARWYDSATGAFLSVDPVIASLAAPDTQNAYAYARGNPMRYVDPTGLASICNHDGCFLVGDPLDGFGSTAEIDQIASGTLRLFAPQPIRLEFVDPENALVVTSGEAPLIQGPPAPQPAPSWRPGKSQGGQRGSFLDSVADRATDVAATIAVDAYAFAFGNTVGKLWTLGQDLYDLGKGVAQGNWREAGEALLFTPLDLAFPNYGYYSGLRYGLRQFGTDNVPRPLNQVDWAARRHDIEFRHGQWIRDVWSPSTPGRYAGPFGLVYQSVGTPFFALGSLLQ